MTRSIKLMMAVCGFVLLPASAYAYVGPGAGLGLLAALWALVAAVGAALIFVIAWPIRRMRRRRREALERDGPAQESRTANRP